MGCRFLKVALMAALVAVGCGRQAGPDTVRTDVQRLMEKQIGQKLNASSPICLADVEGKLRIGMVEQVQQDRQSLGNELQPFIPGRHLVLAEDSDSFPLVWDAETKLLAWYQPEIDGGRGWEPLNVTLEAYLDGLFFPESSTTFVVNPLWLDVLRQLEEPA
jgi:hypothetical protein